MTPTRERLERAREAYTEADKVHRKWGTSMTLAQLQAAEDRYVEALTEWSDSCGLVTKVPTR